MPRASRWPATTLFLVLVLRGSRVTLRPLRPDELDAIVDGRRLLDESAHISVGDERERVQRRIERSGRLVEGRLDLGIEAEGRLVGEIDARGPEGFIPRGVFELGIALFDPGSRGQGYGSEALKLLTDHLFEAERAVRVQAGTAVGNTAMKRVLHKLGFAEEGTMRDFLPAGNGRVDCVLYAVTAADRLAR